MHPLVALPPQPLCPPLSSYSYSAPSLNIISLFIGYALDRFGPRRLALISCAICIVGCALFGAADSRKFNVFLPVGGIILLL